MLWNSTVRLLHRVVYQKILMTRRARNRISNPGHHTTITLVWLFYCNSYIDEKSKQQVESKQYSFNPSYGGNPVSPTNSVLSGFNIPTRPGTDQHMSPAHCLPTGMPNLEKSELIPEIQMPHMAALDPLINDQQHY